MRKPNTIDYDLSFRSITPRNYTDMIVFHHTGNPTDDDLSAEDIHDMHKSNGWAGIGYHFVIRKNGQIEEGRPLYALGAHTEGENYHTVGIHVSGNFEIGEPTKEQIESSAMLVGWLCEHYGLEVTPEFVVAHRDLMATACCGENLYNQLQTIRGKAIWYQQHYGEEK